MDLRASDIRLIQESLAEKGLYTKKIDGKVGPGTLSACQTFLSAHSDEVPSEHHDWPNTRIYAASLQLILRQSDHDPGPVDGYYGPLTRDAADWLMRERSGVATVQFDTISPKDVNPNGWPRESTADLNAHYGKVNPPNCPLDFEKVDSPWVMGLDWDMSKKRTFFRVHKLVAPSLSRILKATYQHYGQEGIEKHGLNRFSGDAFCRNIRGGSRPSTHAWGIAVDFYGSRNELKRSTNDTPPPPLAHPELNFFWERWEEEGWYSLGRMEDRDWMHVQAAKGKRSAFYHR
ncbi:MAG: peptidoglycan-binding domain-containing protein [Pseudomonadota bacterium]